MPAVNIAQRAGGRAEQGITAWKGWKCKSGLVSSVIPELRYSYSLLPSNCCSPSTHPAPCTPTPLHIYRKIM